MIGGRVGRRRRTEEGRGAPIDASWLERAAAYFRSPVVHAYPAFGVSEYGVGSTG